MRYIPNTDEQRVEMLKTIGVSSIEDLFADLPESSRLDRELEIPAPVNELELMTSLKKMSRQNVTAEDCPCFLGAGVYDHFVPLVIDHLISREEFTTSYTPYQPEISQGTLQAIFEYQTMVCELTGMDVSNASIYDGATSMAEAAMMAASSTKRNSILVARAVNPQSRSVLKTYASVRDIEIREVGNSKGVMDNEELKGLLNDSVAAVIVQSPNFFGNLEDLRAIGDIAHANKSLFIVSTDLMALSLLEAPGKMGADVVVGDGQSLGNPMNLGGPHFGFFAATKKLMRKIPGRIVGQTLDRDGKRAYVLTLQAREQHIRREKATSNICSNQNLCLLVSTIYLSLMGREGLKEVALQSMSKAVFTKEALLKTGKFSSVFDGPFYREFVVKSKESPSSLNEKLLEHGFIGGYDLSEEYPELDGCWLVAVTEKRSRQEIDDFVRIAGGE